MPVQDYSNHRQTVPLFLALLGVLALTAIGAIVNLYNSLGDHQRLYSASLILVLTVCVMTLAFLARSFPLRAQDRAIRAEENLRHYILTGKLLDSRLTVHQIIALRFAADSELPALAARAADQNLAADDVKRAVVNWRADLYRV